MIASRVRGNPKEKPPIPMPNFAPARYPSAITSAVRSESAVTHLLHRSKDSFVLSEGCSSAQRAWHYGWGDQGSVSRRPSDLPDLADGGWEGHAHRLKYFAASPLGHRPQEEALALMVHFDLFQCFEIRDDVGPFEWV